MGRVVAINNNRNLECFPNNYQVCQKYNFITNVFMLQLRYQNAAKTLKKHEKSRRLKINELLAVFTESNYSAFVHIIKIYIFDTKLMVCSTVAIVYSAYKRA